MLYLILAVISSAMISLLMRLSEKYTRGGIGMLVMNYLMCCILAFAFTGGIDLFPADPGLPRTLLLGVIGGVFFLGAFMLLQWNISLNGVVLPATFMKLGIIVPTLMSILIFGETPRATQIIGLIAVVCAILLMQEGGRQGAGSIPGLIVLLLAAGGADSMSKIYEEIASPALQNHFLLYIFIVAFLLGIAVCLIRRQKIDRMQLLFGLIIGIPNYLSSRFLLLSLNSVPAVVAFPSYSVATIVLVAVIGVLCFREKLSRRRCAALGVILAALALLNL